LESAPNEAGCRSGTRRRVQTEMPDDAHKGHPQTRQGLSAAEDRRLRSWNLEIAAVLLGDSWRDAGEERAWQHSGGFHIRRRDGSWWSFGAWQGGYSGIGLIRFLKQCDHAEAVAWARTWLDSHAGTGDCDGDVEDDDGRPASKIGGRLPAEHARELLARSQPVDGTPAAAYLQSRALSPPWPPWLRFVADARTGEDGLLAILRAHQTDVGLQVTYLDPAGAKSTVEPLRQAFLWERDHGKAGVFEWSPFMPGTDQLPLLVCEGVEDVLSLATVVPDNRILGLPGIHVLAQLTVSRDSRVIVCRDGDAPGSDADKGLIRGLDRLLLQHAEVLVTAPEQNQDNNDVFQAGGAEALRALVDAAKPASLSLDGEAIRCARMDDADYDRVRREIADKHGIRVRTLDNQRNKARAGEQPASVGVAEDPPWDGDTNLCAALDAALVQARRYMVAEETDLAVAVLWPVHAHLLDNETVRLHRSPRLKIESRTPGCGKTTLLEIVIALSPRGRIRSVYTASTILRTIAASHPTLGLDESDRSIYDDSHIVELIDCGDRRDTAKIDLNVPLPNGGWQVDTIDIFGPMAIAGIDPLLGTAQERCIRIFLRKALAEEVTDHLHDGISPELIEFRRHFAAWAAARTELPMPELPDFLRRQPARLADNWQILLAIADQAGGRWPELIRQAAVRELTAEREMSVLERALVSVRNALDAQPESSKADNSAEPPPRLANDRDRIETSVLIRHMLADPSEDWSLASRGRPINAFFLAKLFRGLLKPPGTQDWWTGTSDRRLHHSGYERHQFRHVWPRYVPTHKAMHWDPSGKPGASGASGACNEKSSENCGFDPYNGCTRSSEGAPDTSGADPALAPGVSGAPVFDLVTKQSANQAEFSPAAPDAPDAPGFPDGSLYKGLDGGGGGPVEAAGPSAEAERQHNLRAQVGHEAVALVGKDGIESVQSIWLAEVARSRAAHPAWSIAKLAKDLRQPVERVKRALAKLDATATGQSAALALSAEDQLTWHGILALVREANALGVRFRFSGARLLIKGWEHLSPVPQEAFHAHEQALRAFLGGGEDDVEAIEFLDKLGVTARLVTEREAVSATLEVLEAEAARHGGFIGLDVETAPRPGQGQPRPYIRINKDGALAADQPKIKDRTALDPYQAEIRLLQLYAGGTECFLFHGLALAALLDSGWLRTQHLVAHNATFEWSFLHHHANQRPNIPDPVQRPGRVECSLQATGLIIGVEYNGGGRKLEATAEHFLARKPPKALQTSDWAAVELSSGQLSYAASDAVLAYRLWPILKADLGRTGRYEAYELQRRAIPPVAEMQLHGLLLDSEEHSRQTEAWKVELAEARQRYLETTGKPPPRTPDEIRAWLVGLIGEANLAGWPRTKTGQLSIETTHLKRLVGMPGTIDVLRILALQKLLSTFGPTLIDKTNPVTRRLHPGFNIAGAKSGRFTSSHPNMQQLPARRAPEFRRCIIAAPGNMLVGCDWSQIELRAAAWIGGDQELSRIYEEGRDLHKEMASTITGVPLDQVTKEQRQAAKPVSFGALYGIGATSRHRMPSPTTTLR
jgi:hypothetical protein